MDAALVSHVRRKRCPTSIACTGIQPRKLPTIARDAGRYRGLDTHEFAREADQDRREGRRSRPLCRLPDGGGRHSARPVLGHLADDRRTSATTGRIDGVARLVVASLIETTGEVRLDDRKYDIFRGST